MSRLRRSRNDVPTESDGGISGPSRSRDGDNTVTSEPAAQPRTGGRIRRNFRKRDDPADGEEAKPHREEKPDSDNEGLEMTADGDSASGSKLSRGRSRGNTSGQKDSGGDKEDKPTSRGSRNAPDSGTHEEDGATANLHDKGEKDQLQKDIEAGPLRVLEPIRTNPIGAIKMRHKKLDRLHVESLPELHFIGKIVSGQNIAQEQNEGGSCRWRVDHAASWRHLGGDLQGQTQVSYAQHDYSSECFPFDHPLDLHFAEAGMQAWGSLRLCVQTYRLDIHGRRILGGYGFAHLPTTPGLHNIEISLWRPVGSKSEEMDSYFLGRVPALLTHEPIYDSAWQDRERLVTTAAGKIFVQLYIITRYMDKHNVDSN